VPLDFDEARPFLRLRPVARAGNVATCLSARSRVQRSNRGRARVMKFAAAGKFIAPGPAAGKLNLLEAPSQ
jgi:hypothetical protein